jgi:hypothetical protein
MNTEKVNLNFPTQLLFLISSLRLSLDCATIGTRLKGIPNAHPAHPAMNESSVLSIKSFINLQSARKIQLIIGSEDDVHHHVDEIQAGTKTQIDLF